MTTRQDVVQWALGENGKFDGVGYPGHNTYSPDLGRPQEFWCGDFVTDAYKQTGDVLVSMQTGCKTGFAYCPSAYNWARAHGATKASWDAQPGDIVLFDWNGNGEADHTELVVGWGLGVLRTIGGDSGPSNVDRYKGQGGVHMHDWHAPEGTGNPQILCVIDAAKAASHGFQAKPVPPKPAPPVTGPLLMLKSPMMHGPAVHKVQVALNQHGAHLRADSIYGRLTRDAVIAFQGSHGLHRDGIVGPDTHRVLGA